MLLSDKNLAFYLPMFCSLGFRKLHGLTKVPYSLNNFDINYIIFKNVENYPKNQLWKKIMNLAKSFLFVEMKMSKLINYSSSDVCQSC